QQLWKLCSQHLRVEELSALQLLACILYILPAEQDHWGLGVVRVALIRQSFSLAPTLEPMMVHHCTNRLVEHFETHSSRSTTRNHLLQLSRLLAKTTGVGRAVSVCLLWGVIFSAANVNLDLHQYRDLSELHPLLMHVPVETFGLNRLEQVLYSVAMLLHLLLCCPDVGEFLRSGYPSWYFRILPADVARIRGWLDHALTFQTRKGFATERLQTSLQYLQEKSVSYCPQCRAPEVGHGSASKPECVLGRIRK
ncbi:hypothetical protein KR009_009461, partial [Drosophila setifemur]